MSTQNSNTENSQSSEMFLLSAENFTNEKFYVARFHGTEALNELFNFSIDFVCTNKSLDTDLLMSNLTTFSIVRKNGEISTFSGYPINVGQSGHFGDYAYYHIDLRPTFWKMTQLAGSRIFLNKNIKEIIKEILNEQQFFNFSNDFHFTKNDYPQQEFVMQYNETNFDFITWNLEQNGAYFYFDQDDSNKNNLKDKLVFCDQQSSHKYITGNSKLAYAEVSGLDFHRRDEIVYSFKLEQSPLPKNIVVRDYDWRKPNNLVTAEAIVSENGLGTIYLSNENVETEAEAQRIAKIRAEELQCHSKTYYGKSVIPALRPGFTFELTQHYNERFNQKYLLTKVIHQGTQESFLSMKLGIPLQTLKSSKNFLQNLVENNQTETQNHYYYYNEFECIQADQIYHPKRTAPRAEIKGVIRGFIDCAGDASRPEVDEFGRYKVVFPFDISGRSNGKASCWIRRSQEQVGQGSGLNFPLLGGVEVTISFINGNPNLPIISGALANGETQSLAKNTNNSIEGIYTAGGNHLLFGNNDKKQGFSLLTAAGKGITMGAGSLSSSQTTSDFGLNVSNMLRTDLNMFGASSLSNMRKLDAVYSPPSATHFKDTKLGWIATIPGLIGLVKDVTSKFIANDSLAYEIALTALKAAQVSLETAIGIVLAKENKYSATVRTSKNFVYSKLEVLPYSKAEVIAWMSVIIANSLSDIIVNVVDDVSGKTESKFDQAKNDYQKALENYNKTPNADNYEDLNKKLSEYNNAKTSKRATVFKYANSILDELLPEIISLALFCEFNGSLSKCRLGGVLLNSDDANITLAARDPIALHTARGVLINTEDIYVQDGSLYSKEEEYIGETFNSSGNYLNWGIADKDGKLPGDYKEGEQKFDENAEKSLTDFLQNSIKNAATMTELPFKYNDNIEKHKIMENRFIANQTEHIINAADYGTDIFSGQKYNVAYSFVYSTKQKDGQNGGLTQMRMHTKGSNDVKGYSCTDTGFIVDVFDINNTHGISLNAYLQPGIKKSLGQFPNSSLELHKNLANFGVRAGNKTLGIKSTETNTLLGIISKDQEEDDDGNEGFVDEVISGLEIEAEKLVINVGEHKIVISKNDGIILRANGKDVDIQGITFKSNKMDKVKEIKGTADLKLDGGVIKIG